MEYYSKSYFQARRRRPQRLQGDHSPPLRPQAREFQLPPFMGGILDVPLSFLSWLIRKILEPPLSFLSWLMRKIFGDIIVSTAADYFIDLLEIFLKGLDYVFQVVFTLTVLYIDFLALVHVLMWITCYVKDSRGISKSYGNETYSSLQDQLTHFETKNSDFNPGSKWTFPPTVYLSKNDTQLPLAHVHDLFFNESVWELPAKIIATINQVIQNHNDILESNLKRAPDIKNGVLLARKEAANLAWATSGQNTHTSLWKFETHGTLLQLLEDLAFVKDLEKDLNETRPSSYAKNKLVWSFYFDQLQMKTLNLESSAGPLSEEIAIFESATRDLQKSITKELNRLQKTPQKYDATKESIFEFAKVIETTEILSEMKNLLQSLNQDIAPAKAAIKRTQVATKKTDAQIKKFETLARKQEKQPIEVFFKGIDEQISALEKMVEVLGREIEEESAKTRAEMEREDADEDAESTAEDESENADEDAECTVEDESENVDEAAEGTGTVED